MPPEPSEDRIEIIGRRIGRSLGYLFATGLLIYLLATYVF
jgi:tetrahydromethanopterin S-methyltransferase subunit G